MPMSRLNICGHAAFAAYSDFATGVLAIRAQLGLDPARPGRLVAGRVHAAPGRAGKDYAETVRLAGIQPERTDDQLGPGSPGFRRRTLPAVEPARAQPCRGPRRRTGVLRTLLNTHAGRVRLDGDGIPRGTVHPALERAAGRAHD